MAFFYPINAKCWRRNVRFCKQWIDRSNKRWSLNVASNGEALNGDIYTIESGNIDIYGNGYVSKSGTGWGETFGTSFATPKVAADLTNFYNNMYLASERAGILKLLSKI